MMNWEHLVDAVVDGRFRLRTLSYAGKKQAEFTALCAGTEGAGATVTLLALEPDEIDQVESEMARAAELQHPHLLKILGVGRWRSRETELLYLASEAPEETLAEKLRSGPLSEAAAERVLSHIAACLEFLHERGFVYRNVTPQTIVRVGPAWKLADYGGMAREGEPSADLPSFLNGSPYTAPEAYDGQLLRAWDIWSFGTLMTELLTGSTSPFLLPVRFEEIRRRCSERDPAARASASEIAAMLPRPVVKVAPAPVIAPKVPVAEQAENVLLEGVERKQSPAEQTRARESQSSRHLRAAKRLFWVPALAALLLAFVWGRGGDSKPAAPVPAPAVKAPAASAPRGTPSNPDRPSPMPRPGDERRRQAAQRASAPPATAPAQPPQKTQPTERVSGKVITGRADFAGDDMNGRRTASGERFNNNALTAAARSYPLGTRLRVTNLKNNRSTVVKVNDRGSFRRGYVIRLTRKAARELDFARTGSAEVRLEIVKGD
ncbi:MAG TPA: septal ring lytic transglycosylase RlpA family protein [Bryobacteraceae bacterium]|nr:septal ring lytic transglycosylase RlpA family protein [Bryobacteraceae bacterium]